jgi:hypothetical protein
MFTILHSHASAEFPRARMHAYSALIGTTVLVLCTQVNMMLVMLLWVYIHTGQAWKVCLATVEKYVCQRYPDILPKDICRKTFCRTDILPNGHFADGRFAEQTFCRMDILPNGHFTERTVCRTNSLPKIEMLFRQNVWDCASFLNFVILNQCVK